MAVGLCYYLVSALVGDDPHARGDGSLEEPVGGPQHTPPDRSRDGGGVNEGGGPVEARDHQQIGDEVAHRAREGTFKAVGWDSLAQLTNGECRHLSRLTVHAQRRGGALRPPSSHHDV